MGMTSSRPYLVRALYEWILDNQCTPYILVNSMYPDVLVPQNFVNDGGQVVLNISPTAVINFSMDTDSISFGARFGGIPTDIYVPYAAIMGIYAKENQQGMIFEVEPDQPDPDGTETGSEGSSATPARPSLKVVK